MTRDMATWFPVISHVPWHTKEKDCGVQLSAVLTFFGITLSSFCVAEHRVLEIFWGFRNPRNTEMI